MEYVDSALIIGNGMGLLACVVQGRWKSMENVPSNANRISWWISMASVTTVLSMKSRWATNANVFLDTPGYRMVDARGNAPLINSSSMESVVSVS